MMISIVTPWAGATVGSLLADYAAATEGAEIVTVDNACPETDADALKTFTAPRGHYTRNDTNAGFAAANNQGYAWATGDIIVFLNSDIAGEPSWLEAVTRDVQDGALYGPSLQQQLVAGTFWPYIEGWCIAATTATWEQLTTGGGPWDAAAYPGPYWEDNDLCLRALAAGISLVQTAWSVLHKGGRTAGGLLAHATSFEANRATFARRALPYAARLAQAPATPAQAAYQHHVANQSDIQHHLPLLYALARGNVLELGTRTGVSTAALLAGVERRGGHVYSVDIDERSATVAAGHPLWSFRAGDSLATGLVDEMARHGPYTLALIDTIHTHQQVSRELMLWSETMAPGGTICVHDTETFPGVRVAVEEFCAAKHWPVTFVLPCHGMAVIEVPA